MPDKPKLGRPKKDWRYLLIEMARQELQHGSSETPTSLARHVLAQYPAEDRPDGNLYRQLKTGRPVTEVHLVSRLCERYQRERSRFLSEAQAIDDARRSGQQRTRHALGLTTDTPQHRGCHPKSFGSLNTDLANRLFEPALLEDRAAAFLQGHKDALRRRHR
ncbi:hypothetical protein JMJ56_31890 [Belnapia sp. T18]|uniref:Uncharacterized protein n=1 Tax=Belnapia arida TaxID=2804533 RepID=A0ABS1UF15_9PROT|nr:hypothetical protein [Belnapia arida]MBL6082569.1 hypothetical protein [Belnapia arida]